LFKAQSGNPRYSTIPLSGHELLLKFPTEGMFEHISPRSLATPQDVIEHLELQHIAQEFRLEVEYREQFDAYCEWYYRTAQQNRRDYEQMKAELNFRDWFSRTIRPAR
jgi:hypothetical protein